MIARPSVAGSSEQPLSPVAPQVGWDLRGRAWRALSAVGNTLSLDGTPFVKACVGCAVRPVTGAYRWTCDTASTVAAVAGYTWQAVGVAKTVTQSARAFYDEHKETIAMMLAGVSDPEKAVELINNFVEKMTSEEQEKFFAQWMDKKPTGAAGGAQGPSVSRFLPESGRQAATLTMQYSCKVLDDLCQQQCRELDPSTNLIVVDLGRSTKMDPRSTTAEGSLAKMACVRTAADIIADIGENHDSKYIYLYQVSLGGQVVWVRRERDKVKEELEATMQIAFGHIMEALKRRYQESHGNLPQNVLSEVMGALQEHFTWFSEYLKHDGLALEKLGVVCADGALQSDKVRSHAEKLALALKETAFPGGQNELPLPAHYRGLLDKVVIPAVLKQVLEKTLQKVATPEVMNTLLLQIVKPLDPMHKENSTEQAPSARVPGEPNRSKLYEDAGNFMVSMLRLASADFRYIYDSLVTEIESYGPHINIRDNIRDALGKMLGDVLSDSMKKGADTPEKLFDMGMMALSDGFLRPALKDDDLVETERRIVQTSQELDSRLQELLGYFYPIIKNTIVSAVSKQAQDANKKLEGQLPEEIQGAYGAATTALAKAVHAVWAGGAKAIESLKAAFDAFTGRDELLAYLDAKDRAEEVANFMALMHSSTHAKLWHRLFDVVVKSITNCPVQTDGDFFVTPIAQRDKVETWSHDVVAVCDQTARDVSQQELAIAVMAIQDSKKIWTKDLQAKVTLIRERMDLWERDVKPWDHLSIKLQETAEKVETLRNRVQSGATTAVTVGGRKVTMQDFLGTLDELRVSLEAAKAKLSKTQGNVVAGVGNTPSRTDQTSPVTGTSKKPKDDVTKVQALPPVKNNISGRLLCLRDFVVGVPISLVRNVMGAVVKMLTDVDYGVRKVLSQRAGLYDKCVATVKVIGWAAGYCAKDVLYSVGMFLYHWCLAFAGMFSTKLWLVHVADHSAEGPLFRSKAASWGHAALGLFQPVKVGDEHWGHVTWKEKRIQNGKPTVMEVEVTTPLEADARKHAATWHGYREEICDRIINHLKKA